MNPLSDEKVIDSWRKNAAPWREAVCQDQIASRTLVTNAAIVATVLSVAPAKVLDIGCGEGWLARALAAHAIDVLGIDVVPELIAYARAAGGGRFQTLAYAEFAAGKLDEAFDVAVCNFSLIGDESVSDVLRGARAVLDPGRYLIVQTLHPMLAIHTQVNVTDYVDGWRSGSSAGFDEAYVDPAPWYFRTLESWVRLFGEHGFQLTQIREPIHPQTGLPASIIFVGVLSAG